MHARPSRLARFVPLFVAAAVWVCAGFPAAASEISGAGDAGPPAAGHSCRCGMNCGGRCCCAKRSTERPAPPAQGSLAARPAAPDRTPVGPCMDSAPCDGDDGALPPATPTLSSSLDPAALTAALTAPPRAGERRVAPPALPVGPAPAVEPPTEPPRAA